MITYILIGVAFMFSFEYLMNTKAYKRVQLKFKPKLKRIELNLWARIIGILFWPLWLVIFLYYFFKLYFK